MVQAVSMSPAFVKLGANDAYININDITGISRGSRNQKGELVYNIDYKKSKDNGTTFIQKGQISENAFKSLNIII